MPNRYLVIDLASAPIAGAEAFIDKSAIEAPTNYKKPDVIANYVEEEYARRVQMAGLDLDLARITALGISEDGVPDVRLCRSEAEEGAALCALADELSQGPSVRLVSYNGFSFDLPLLMRRARYLDVQFPKLNTDRYRSPHVDLLAELTDRDPSRRRPLSFYVRRLGWTDLKKPLTGEEESHVPETGKWDELAASVEHDLVAAYRLACWLGVVQEREVAVL